MEQKRKLNTVSSFPVLDEVREDMILMQESPVFELCNVEVCDMDGNPAIQVSNDIFLLFNQQRLAALGTDTVNKWLESLTPQNDALAQLRSKCTDEQLLQFVKSKYIQSASELEAWSGYLNAHFDKEIAALAGASDKEEMKEEETKETVSTSETKSE